MSKLSQSFDNEVPAECARLSDVIAQTDLQGQQLTRVKTNFFTRSCRALCSCLTPNRISRQVKYAQLPPKAPENSAKNTLVLDLDETLVHSSFITPSTYDFIVPVNLDGYLNYAYVAKRPGVDEFLRKAIEAFEVVIYTASLKIYAEPLIETLIPTGKVLKLYRPSCRYMNGAYVKDLTRLGRNVSTTVIVDVSYMKNSPLSYALQPQNAVSISSWFFDMKDNDLEAVWKILELLINEPDIPAALSKVKKDLDGTVSLSKGLLPDVSSGARGGFNSPIPRGPISFSGASL